MKQNKLTRLKKKEEEEEQEQEQEQEKEVEMMSARYKRVRNHATSGNFAYYFYLGFLIVN